MYREGTGLEHYNRRSRRRGNQRAQMCAMPGIKSLQCLQVNYVSRYNVKQGQVRSSSSENLNAANASNVHQLAAEPEKEEHPP